MNINRFHIPNCEPKRFELFNSIVSINEGSKETAHYIVETTNTKDDYLKFVIKLIYFLSPDMMYRIVLNSSTIATPNRSDGYGTIDYMKKTIEYHPLYSNGKFFTFCVYNDKRKYTIGAIRNCIQYVDVYPDYQSIFYIRDDVPRDIVETIKSEGGVVVPTLCVPDWFMMFCRFLPAEACSFMASRDTDCRLIEREIWVNKKFIDANNSQYTFHIIRDHPWHNTLILGGMWSIKNYTFPNLRFLMLDFCLKNMDKERMPFGFDQSFLTQSIYPLLNQNNILVHDNFHMFNGNKKKIKHVRKNREFIGEPYDEEDKPEGTFRDMIKD